MRSICIPRANSATASANRAHRGLIDTQATLTDFKSEHKHDMRQVDDVLAEIRQALKVQADSAKADAEGLRAETASLRAELSAQNEELCKTQSTVASLAKQLDQVKASYVELRTSHADLRGAHEAMASDMQVALEREHVLEGRIVQLELASKQSKEEDGALREMIVEAGEKHRLLVEESSLFLTDLRETVQNDIDALRNESATALQALRGENKAVKLELEGQIEAQALIPPAMEARVADEFNRQREMIDALNDGQHRHDEELARQMSSHSVEIAECRRLVAEETNNRLASERLTTQTQADQAAALNKSIEAKAEAMEALKRVTANESHEIRRMVTDVAREVQMACAEEVEASMRKQRETHEQLGRDLHQDVEATRAAIMKSNDQVNGNTSQEFWQVLP